MAESAFSLYSPLLSDQIEDPIFLCVFVCVEGDLFIIVWGPLNSFITRLSSNLSRKRAGHFGESCILNCIQFTEMLVRIPCANE